MVAVPPELPERPVASMAMEVAAAGGVVGVVKAEATGARVVGAGCWEGRQGLAGEVEATSAAVATGREGAVGEV